MNVDVKARHEKSIEKLAVDKIFVLVITCVFSMVSAAGFSPVGTWQTVDDKSGKPKSVIEISLVNNALEGRVLELLDPDSASTCKKCKGERAGQPIVGMIVLWNVIEAENKKSWGGGKILDPKKGKAYSVKLTVQKDGDELKVRGFIGAPFIGRTQVWEKLNN
jgi:uncharacterized protein (DUF2147 family)